MSNLGGMSDASVIGVGAAALVFILGYLGDIYTTMIGVQHGFKEAGLVSKALFGLMNRVKWLNLQCLQTLLGGGVLWLGAFFTNYGAAPAAAFYGILGVGEAIQAYRNYRLLKAAKISLK